MPTETLEEAPSTFSEKFSKLMDPEPVEAPTPTKEKAEPPPPEKVEPAKVIAPNAKIEEAIKPPEPKEFFKIDMPANISGKTAEGIKKIKENAYREIELRETQIAALKTELETAKKSFAPIKVTDDPEYQSLKKKHDDLDANFKIVSIERHPQFIEYFGNKTKLAIAAAKSVIGAELAPQLEKILHVANPESRMEQLETLASELSPFRQGEFATTISKLKEIEAEKAAEIEKAGKSYETLTANQKAEQEQSATQKKESTAKLKNDALTLARSSMEAFKTKDGDEAHNASVKQNEGLVEAFFDGTIDPKIIPAIPALAAEALYLRQTKIPELEAELKKRNEIIAGYQGSKPKLDGGGSGEEKNGKTGGESFTDGYKRLMTGG